jgi:hypothetical protein
MARLYHPKLGTEIEVPDVEETIKVHEASGWRRAPEPEEIPGHEPEPVTYAPVVTSAEEPARPAASATRGDWAAWVDYLGGRSEGLTKAELQAKADELETEDNDS